MSSLKVENITNQSNIGISNLSLASDGSVTSFEGLSISDAAAYAGLNDDLRWDTTNLNKNYDLDRTKYNSVRIKGWFDLSYEPSNGAGIGLYIQPTIGGVAYTLSQLNGGTVGTFIQTGESSATPQANYDQMIYNTSATPNTLGWRWIIDHEIIFADKVVWSTTLPSLFLDNDGGTLQRVVRQMLPQGWNTTNGNNIDGFTVLTNSITNVSALSQGQLGVSISRNTSFGLLT